MPAMTSRSKTRRESLNLRIKPDDRGLIDRAAELTGKNRTEFVLEAARRAAVEVLTDRTLFSVNTETYEKFAAALNARPEANDELHKTMQTPPPWDRP